MNRRNLSRVFNAIEDTYIEEALLASPQKAAAEKGMHTMNKKTYTHRHTKRIITFALAACLLLALGAAAYAFDLFGLRAIKIEDGTTPQKLERNPDGTAEWVDNPDGARVSITQPQDVPEELDPAIAEKVKNSELAWAEWDTWRREHAVRVPEVFMPPEGTCYSNETENPDGSVTIEYYSDTALNENGRPVIDENGLFVFEGLIETRTATAEEYAEYLRSLELINVGFVGYDFNYHVQTQEMADKLEEIAAKYGLNLRHSITLLSQDFGDNPSGLPLKEMHAKVNEICGGFFRTLPTGYDKVYYFDEGTFCVSFYATENYSAGPSCYFYNSPYSTLSSGREVVGRIDDVNALTQRTHTAPDGTEVTVIRSSKDVFAYVYLENSFAEAAIHNIDGLSDADIDKIIDMVNFSAIKTP